MRPHDFTDFSKIKTAINKIGLRYLTFVIWILTFWYDLHSPGASRWVLQDVLWWKYSTSLARRKLCVKWDVRYTAGMDPVVKIQIYALFFLLAKFDG